MVKRTALTKKGMAVYEETNEAFRQLGNKVLAEFSEEEMENFIQLLDKLKNKILENSKIIF